MKHLKNCLFIYQNEQSCARACMQPATGFILCGSCQALHSGARQVRDLRHSTHAYILATPLTLSEVARGSAMHSNVCSHASSWLLALLQFMTTFCRRQSACMCMQKYGFIMQHAQFSRLTLSLKPVLRIFASFAFG